jgi:hypothetical protein
MPPSGLTHSRKKPPRILKKLNRFTATVVVLQALSRIPLPWMGKNPIDSNFAESLFKGKT